MNLIKAWEIRYVCRFVDGNPILNPYCPVAFEKPYVDRQDHIQ